MKRLIAGKIDETAEQFIKKCEDSGKFDDKQIEEIRIGFEKGLTMEQVGIYAKPVFNRLQMREIRDGFTVNGLTMEQVRFYADPKFNSNQMDEIIWNFENGLTIEEVKEKYNLKKKE